MNIEIHQPELQALIQQRMASGAFHDVEDALIQALKCTPPPEEPVDSGDGPGAYPAAVKQATPIEDEAGFGDLRSDHESFVRLLESVRGLLTDEEVDTLFKRDPPSVAHSTCHEWIPARHQHSVRNAAARTRT